MVKLCEAVLQSAAGLLGSLFGQAVEDCGNGNDDAHDDENTKHAGAHIGQKLCKEVLG